MKVLFISRKFPPSVGGMENFAYGLTHGFRQLGQSMEVWSWGGPRWHAVWWIPMVWFRLLVSRQADVIHVMDGVLAIVAPVARLYGRKVVITLHGLEITYPNPVYRHLFLWGLKRVQVIVSVSQATANGLQQLVCGKPGFDTGMKYVVITHGVPAPRVDRTEAEKKIASQFSITPEAKVVLLVGRLIERKGQRWFLDQVAPHLISLPSTVIVVVGDGPQREQVIEAARLLHGNGKEQRIWVRGRVSHDELALWYARADVMVMPNRPVVGDMEGFGMVALEAQSYGCPVVASRLEGLTDAVEHEHHGVLVSPEDAQAFLAAIQHLSLWDMTRRQHLATQTLQHHAWGQIANAYLQVFEACYKQQ